VKQTDVERTDLKRAEVKRTDVQRADVQRADVQLADLQLADVKGMGVKRAKQKGAHVIVPNYYPRPPGRGPLTLARLVQDGHRLWFYFGCTFKFTFYGLRYVACVQNWSDGFTRD
jgi:uncharacterized protein YjbI with pentapeptide repeats